MGLGPEPAPTLTAPTWLAAGQDEPASSAAPDLAPAAALDALAGAWRLQQDLTQLLKVALGDDPDPTQEPPAFRTLLARAGGARDFRQLRARLEAARLAGRKAYEAIVRP